MKKTLFIAFAMLSSLFMTAQETLPRLKKVTVRKPEILTQNTYKLEDLNREFCSENKWGTKKTVKEHWVVYSDRSRNTLYLDAEKSQKLENTLAFGQEVVIAQIKGDMAYVYEVNTHNTDWPNIPDYAEMLGWVPMENLLLWNVCPTDMRGVQYKALISINLNKLKGHKEYKGFRYDSPDGEQNPRNLDYGMSFYFVMKEDPRSGRALLCENPTYQGRNNLFGWVDGSAYSPWNQRTCLEPNWNAEFVANHKGKEIGVYSDKQLTTGNKVTSWVYGQSNGDEERWYEYRMDPAQLRFPILDKVVNDEHIHCTSFSAPNGGKANYDEDNRSVTTNVEQIRNMRGQMNVILVVEATTEMQAVFPSIKESIEKCRSFNGQGLNVKVGAVLYRGANQGVDGIDVVSLTNYDDLLLNSKFDAVKANGKLDSKERDVALSLAIEKAADANTMGYNKDQNTLLIVVGSRGAPDSDTLLESPQLLNKLVENNVQIMSVQVVQKTEGSWANFNFQIADLIKTNVDQQYAAIGDCASFSPRAQNDGYNFYSKEKEESVLFAQIRYSKDSDKALTPPEITKYIDNGINKFAETSVAWNKHFEESLGNLAFDPDFLKRHLGEEGYQQWKKVKAISAFDGYTKQKDSEGENYWNYILFFSGRELEDLITKLEPAYEAAKNGSDDRKVYVNAIRDIIKGQLGQSDDKAIDEYNIDKIQELLYGLNVHIEGRYNRYTLKQLLDQREVITTRFQSILSDFKKKYERLNDISGNYTYRVLMGKDYYYWIPVEDLPY